MGSMFPATRQSEGQLTQPGAVPTGPQPAALGCTLSWVVLGCRGPWRLLPGLRGCGCLWLWPGRAWPARAALGAGRGGPPLARLLAGARHAGSRSTSSSGASGNHRALGQPPRASRQDGRGQGRRRRRPLRQAGAEEVQQGPGEGRQRGLGRGGRGSLLALGKWGGEWVSMKTGRWERTENTRPS